MYVKLKSFLRSSLSLCLFVNFIFCRIFISEKCSSTLASTNLHRSLHPVFCRVCCREPPPNRNDCCREISRLDFVTSIMFLHGKKAGISIKFYITSAITYVNDSTDVNYVNGFNYAGCRRYSLEWMFWKNSKYHRGLPIFKCSSSLLLYLIWLVVI